MQLWVCVSLDPGVSGVEVNQLSVSLPLQAQLCLASVYSQESVRDGRKSVQCLKMAAERGVRALLDASKVLSMTLSLISSPIVPSQSFCIRKQSIPTISGILIFTA